MVFGRRAAIGIAGFALLVGCGYRTVGSTLPDGGEPLFLEAVDDAALGELDLGPLLQQELARRLMREGVALSRTPSGAARLRVRLVALRSGRAVVDRARRLAGGKLELELEGWLTDAHGETLWRSGLISVGRVQPVSRDPGASGAARAVTLRALAARGADRCVALLLSGL